MLQALATGGGGYSGQSSSGVGGADMLSGDGGGFTFGSGRNLGLTFGGASTPTQTLVTGAVLAAAAVLAFLYFTRKR